MGLESTGFLKASLEVEEKVNRYVHQGQRAGNAHFHDAHTVDKRYQFMQWISAFGSCPLCEARGVLTFSPCHRSYQESSTRAFPFQ